ncbi:MAG: pyruvate dehydrogenase complex dihydrolipoamide acetyltransferase [Hyphomicrobiales bacterium]|nr:pyruvate dehydrogenase complex dihydrolipoamide acetyltransferase [Hyphomicrobiales bacterium]
MTIEILMPALSPTMEKGNLAKWLVKEGDKVATGDVIAEIETDKATMEVEAVDEGTVGKIVVAEGTEDVPVNQPIALLLEEGEEASALKSAPALKKLEKSAPAAAPKPTKAEKQAMPEPAVSSPAPSAAPAPAAPGKGNGAGRIFASPLAKRLAGERGIDLAALAGSGPRGRIVKRDVEEAVPGAARPAAEARAPAPAPSPAPPITEAEIAALYAPGTYEALPHDGMRKTIARRLVQSKRDIPHYYLNADCQLDALIKLRRELNAQAPKGADANPEYRLSVNDFLIKALALALQKVPMANATWTENARLIHKHSDVGVAVALPDGLITPVIRNAELKTISAISAEMKDLALRARSKKLKPEEYQGGTTTLSNLGMYGVDGFTAVINPPHATILAVGAGAERPVVRSGRIAIATVMTATLSCDHRVVDGALGADLLRAFKSYVEKPMSMLV